MKRIIVFDRGASKNTIELVDNFVQSNGNVSLSIMSRGPKPKTTGNNVHFVDAFALLGADNPCFHD